MPDSSGNTSATGGPLGPTSPSPLDDLDLDTVIGTLIAAVSGLGCGSVIPRWQQDAQPREPDAAENWVAVGVTTSQPDSMPSQTHRPDGDGYTILRSVYRLDVLASFYGPNSDGLARLTRDGFYVAQNREAMRAQGLNLVGFDAIRRVPEIIAMQTRRRSDLPFQLLQVIERRYEIRNLLQGQGTIRGDGSRLIDTPFLSPLPPA